jgi:hypothetical protein
MAANVSPNLGVFPGLLAAAALLLDYVLVVAVGISAGVGALVSAAPSIRLGLRRMLHAASGTQSRARASMRNAGRGSARDTDTCGRSRQS